MAQQVFNLKVAVLDRLIQEVQELADLYVRLLEIGPDDPAEMVHEHVADVLQALAKTYIGYRHTVTTVAATIAQHGGLEVRADFG